eukprot:4169583-Lingulodinium_polyedra.AAC.1
MRDLSTWRAYSQKSRRGQASSAGTAVGLARGPVAAAPRGNERRARPGRGRGPRPRREGHRKAIAKGNDLTR